MTNATCPRCNGRGYTLRAHNFNADVHAEPCGCTKPERFTMTSLEYWCLTTGIAIILIVLMRWLS